MNVLTRTWKGLIAEKLEDYGKTEGQRWRPRLHIAPPVGWLNDPNGLCQYQGVYHAFYQFSPFDPKGGLKFWGHCTSRDLLHWRFEGTALAPDEAYDCHGVYSGSALVEDGQLSFYYTGNVKRTGDYDYIRTGRESNTVRAVSVDGMQFEGKRLLMSNGDYPEDLTCHVRDPKVWKQEGCYYMVQGARTAEDKGVALLFESEDGEHWNCLHRLETKEPFGYMWECPDVFQVDGYTVLSISPQGVKADGLKYNNVYQSVTTFLDGDFREAVVREDFRELDAGFDFYAPQSFQAEDGRRIQIGWMGMPDVDAYYTNPSVEDGWQHTLTLPRELSVRDGVLCQKPVRELDDWWNFFIPFVNMYSDVPGDCFEVAASGTGGEFRLVLAGGLELSWKEEEGIFWMSFTDQRLGAGRARRGRAVEKLTDLRIIVDVSCVEVFLNGGREVFSTRFYPDREEIGVELRASGFDGRICLHREGT